MKKTSTVFLLLAATVYFLSCVHERETSLDASLEDMISQRSATGSYHEFILPDGTDYAALPNQDPQNPVTAAKVELGRMLFFETGLGLEPKYEVSKVAYSCSSCHVPQRGFTAGRFQGIADGALGFGLSGEGRTKHPLYQGDEVDAQGARPLPVINTTFVTNALWSGAFGSFGANVGTEGVWAQDTLVQINFKGLFGLEANNERALIVHRQVVNKAVTDSLGYTAMFDAAFPDIPVSQRYTRQTAAFAIAAYFRTILTNEAPFQRWLKGQRPAMTDQQKRGAMLFFGKAGCVSCHNSPSLNSQPHQFFALGVKNLYQSKYQVFRTGPEDKRNIGRGGFTGQTEDMHKFKVPQLYNMKNIGFYFHGASKTSLREVVAYFNDGIPENPDVPFSQIAPQFRPLGMTNEEMDDLVEFLENGLYDPNLARYAPTQTMSGNCFPNNDPLSRVEMGCN
ncbi:MAG: c-type cytochrome [Saprospirales bacterium]|nr:c-type cytochrome [Saprospirales bacterium]